MDSVSISLITNNNEEKVSHTKLSAKVQFAFGVGHVINDSYSAFWLSYFLIYVTKVKNLGPKEAGYLILLGQITDAVANILIGKWSDRNICFTLFKRFGRRKSWYCFGVIVNIISVLAIFQPFEIQPHLLLGYLSVLVVLFQIGWAAVQISHLALIPEITPNKDERTKLGATRQFFTVISYSLLYATCLTVFGTANAELETQKTEFSPAFASLFWYIAIIQSILGIICSFIFQFSVKESIPRQEGIIQPCLTFKEIILQIKYWQVLGVYMFTMLFVNSCQMFIPSYVLDTLGKDPAVSAIIPLITYFASGATALILSLKSGNFTRKAMFLFGTAFGLGAILWIRIRSFSTGFGENEIYCVVICIGLAIALLTVTILGLTADLIGNNTESSGFIYSNMTIADKLINGVAVFLVQCFYSDSYQDYYKTIIEGVCGGSLLLAAIIMLTIKSTNTRREGYIPLH